MTMCMKTELLIPFFSVDERLKKQEQEIVEKKKLR